MAVMIYAKNTAKKTGFVATQDIIAPEGGRFQPLSNAHPQAHLAVEVMTLMGRAFLNTARDKRLTLKQSYDAALALDPTIEGFTTYASATGKAAARIIIK